MLSTLTPDKQRRNDRLAELAVTPAESALLNAVHYGLTLPPAELPRAAAAEAYSREPVTAEECRAALFACLDKGWLQVVDDRSVREILSELQEGQVLGPVYGLPEVGGVDFTRAEAALMRSRRHRPGPAGGPPAFAYTDVVHSKTARYFRTPDAALRELEEVRGEAGVVSATDPTPTGPWRVQWWRRFPEGYRIDVERRWRWQGVCSEGEGWYMSRSPGWRSDPGRLRHILDCHNVSPGEWLLLAAMDGPWHKSASRLLGWVSERAEADFGIAASEPECRTGLENCLRYGWLRAPHEAAAEVRALSRMDSAVLPFSEEDVTGRGQIDFTPAGAALYRMVAAEYVGPDWEDDLSVWKEYYPEEHRYCETEEGLRAVVREYEARGEDVRSAQVSPIGPWCVYWWKRFPAGYRLELQIGY